ncbi:16300_t:CDS:2, partial [Funneliformis mosseae]
GEKSVGDTGVVTDTIVTGFIERFILPQIDTQTLASREFRGRVKNLIEVPDNKAKTFLIDINEIVKNLEAENDTLLRNLLFTISGLHKYPLRVRPRCKLYIAGEPYVSARLKYAINKEEEIAIIVE